MWAKEAASHLRGMQVIHISNSMWNGKLPGIDRLSALERSHIKNQIDEGIDIDGHRLAQVEELADSDAHGSRKSKKQKYLV